MPSLHYFAGVGPADISYSWYESLPRCNTEQIVGNFDFCVINKGRGYMDQNQTNSPVPIAVTPATRADNAPI